MAIGRSTKISILLAIDLVFLFVELIVGYAVGSLALVADSFHMLNDVMSLVVALYAIKLTKASVVSPEYSYGWHRAEILAALINGVFLLALCFSIFIEAIERFFSVPEVGNPKLVVIVGSLGLLSNIVGLFLFHEHGHGHGHSHSEPPTPGKADPESAMMPDDLSPLLPSQPIGLPLPVQNGGTTHRRSNSGTRPIPTHRRSDSIQSNSILPAQVRASLVQVAEEIRAETEASEAPRNRSPERRKTPKLPLSQSAPGPGEGGTLEEVLAKARTTVAAEDDDDTLPRIEEGRYTHSNGRRNDLADADEDDEEAPLHSDVHAGHTHSHGTSTKGTSSPDGHGHGHGHGSMNMRAVLLHVIGDALGNVGVIATGLIIWLTEWKYKFYCDPVISLVITIIIFSSALPLVRSASFILLQAVPTSVSLEAVRDAILAIPGVLSVHELHIWQLSESKIVASVHVLVRKSLKKGATKSQIEDDRENVYMTVAAEIRRVLHEYGIHSSTIQPEYALDGEDEDTASVHSGACLIRCMADGECDPANGCCPPPPQRTD